MHTLPHLVKMCAFPFREKVLALDTAPLSGDKLDRPGIGTLEELKKNCRALVEAGVMDRAVEVDYSDGFRKKCYRKHFGTSRLRETHNWKGYPVLGSIFCLEQCRTRYLLHFDSDMLMYQETGYDWIQKAVRLMQENPGFLWARPQGGPLTDKANFYERDYKLKKNPDGYYRLSGFASRVYLLDLEKLWKILPVNILWARKQGVRKDRLPRRWIEGWNHLSGRGLLESWETMLGRKVAERSMARIDIAENRCWTLHPRARGAQFTAELPKIIERVERGDYPPKQAGAYELDLPAWLEYLT
jgi:hypothetical protein